MGNEVVSVNLTSVVVVDDRPSSVTLRFIRLIRFDKLSERAPRIAAIATIFTPFSSSLTMTEWALRPTNATFCKSILLPCNRKCLTTMSLNNDGRKRLLDAFEEIGGKRSRSSLEEKPLHGVVICLTGLNSDKKNNLHALVEKLGGR